MGTDDGIRAAHLVDVIDVAAEELGFPPPVDPTVCQHPPDEQWVLRPGRLACGDCGRVIDHPAA